MSNKVLISVILAVLLSLGGWLALTGKKKTSDPAKAEVQISSEEAASNLESAESVTESDTTFVEYEGTGAIIANEDPDYTALRKRECEKIKDPAIKDRCERFREEIKMRMAKTIQDCAGLKYFKTDCEDAFYMKASESSNNPRICLSIVDEDRRAACKSKSVVKNAVSQGNADACAAIADEATKKNCVAMAEAQKAEKLSSQALLDSMKNSAATGDAASCGKLANFQLRITCLTPIIYAKYDVTLCRYAGTSEEVKRCQNLISYDYDRAIIGQAVSKKDLSLCDKLFDVSLKPTCKSMKIN